MILATSASPRPVPVALGGHERIEQVRLEVRRERPEPLSSISIISGRLTRVSEPGTDRRTPGRNAVCSTMRPLLAAFADRLGGVLHEVEKGLDELVAIAGHGGSDGS